MGSFESVDLDNLDDFLRVLLLSEGLIVVVGMTNYLS